MAANRFDLGLSEICWQISTEFFFTFSFLFAIDVFPCLHVADAGQGLPFYDIS